MTLPRTAVLTAALALPVPAQDRWTEDFGNWDPQIHPVTTADVDGDGKADMVGFGGHTGVWVGFSNGARFDAHDLLLAGFYCHGCGWDTQRHVRTLADINGDGMADIVGFGERYVEVALSLGRRFSKPEPWQHQFGAAGGWRVDEHPRFVADVDGDGDGDLIGCRWDRMVVALGTGSGFDLITTTHAEFGTAQGWTADDVRTMADVNGDGRADLVGFGPRGVVVSLGSPTGPRSPVLWSTEFSPASGTRDPDQTHRVADANGDGRDDVIAFGPGGARISLSTGSGFAPSFRVHAFANEDGWGAETPRHAVDLDGDGFAELVGFGPDGVHMARNSFGQFRVVETTSCRFGTSDCYDPGACGRREFADANGDGALDVIGLYEDGVWVDTVHGGCRRALSAECDNPVMLDFFGTTTAFDVQIDLGLENGGQPYLLLASQSGTSPGTIVDGVAVPLIRDGLLSHLEANFPSSAYESYPFYHSFVGTAGTVSPQGRATAAYSGRHQQFGAYSPARWQLWWAVVHLDDPTGTWRASRWIRTRVGSW